MATNSLAGRVDLPVDRLSEKIITARASQPGGFYL
jgi:hypothetical protein